MGLWGLGDRRSLGHPSSLGEPSPGLPQQRVETAAEEALHPPPHLPGGAPMSGGWAQVRRRVCLTWVTSSVASRWLVWQALCRCLRGSGE
jgi:hypothetical protein